MAFERALRRMEVLGTEKPFGTLVVDWLWERKGALPGMLLLVPTAQSGRRIRLGLAEKGGVLSPHVVTTSHFLHAGEGAPEAVEVLAWIEVLEEMTDWGEFPAAFPLPPDEQDSPGWAIGLARTMAGVRAGLIEGGFMIRSAAVWMKGTVEEERWQDLARLEEKVEKQLADWNYESRNAIVARNHFDWPPEVKEVVLAGMADLSPAVIRVFENAPVPVKILVANETDLDEWGRPESSWTEREIAWPRITLAGDARQQAEAALTQVATAGTASNDITLGSADEEVAAELVRSFGRAGWAIHNPGVQRAPALAGWLAAWRNFLVRPEAAEVMDLLTFPQSGRLVRHQRSRRARALSTLRDSHLVCRADDVTRARIQLEKELAEAGESPRAKHLKVAVDGAVLSEETMAELEDSRERFLRSGFHQGMDDLLEIIDPDRTSGAEEWLNSTKALAEKLSRPAVFWLDLLQSGLEPVNDPPPEERVLDVQGWLELFLESGSHLVICGMNEGLVPSQASRDAWLPEGTRRQLQLSTDETRHARDAYLLTCMLKAREDSGMVDLLLGKSTGSGDVLQPSRLLLAAKGEELAERVEKLFREVSPPEDGLSWELNEAWKWQAGQSLLDERPEKLSVTGFSDYLACPFRFYLKHVRKMQAPDPERGEWTARDFGNYMHWVLEAFGRDEAARKLGDERKIEAWTHAELGRLLVERLGEERPTAVRIQEEVMKQRLTWFSRRQAEEFAEGWRIVEVERSFEISVGGMKVRGQIDRIERHESSGQWRVLDYKTSSKKKNVANAHGTALRSDFQWPEHLAGAEEVKSLLPVGARGKVVEARWTNLQVALYAAAFEHDAEVGYFALGSSEGNVGLSMWPDFGEEEIKSAMACAEWVASRIRKSDLPFWPPAEKPKYDDYEILRFGKEMKEVVR